MTTYNDANTASVREFTEEREKQMLSPHAMLSAKSAGRTVWESPCDLRTDFCRDRDRIIHSKAFRRLKTKTQVFLAPKGDHIRTRLTHTLEVSQIARTLARALRLNEDLTEAIAMGHDLGHTPFGHAGERALDELNPNGFAHYRQSVRVVSLLEKYPGGLNLTAEVLDGILNHTTKNQPATFEGQLVRICDRVAYLNHDIEDCIDANLLSEEMLPQTVTTVLGNSKSERITTLLNDLIANSEDSPCFSDRVGAAFSELHSYMFDAVYIGSSAKEEEKKVFGFMAQLYRYYHEKPEAMPKMYQVICEQEGVDTAVTDYISGMSDSFAVSEFERIYVPRSWETVKNREK